VCVCMYVCVCVRVRLPCRAFACLNWAWLVLGLTPRCAMGHLCTWCLKLETGTRTHAMLPAQRPRVGGPPTPTTSVV